MNPDEGPRYSTDHAATLIARFLFFSGIVFIPLSVMFSAAGHLMVIGMYDMRDASAHPGWLWFLALVGLAPLYVGIPLWLTLYALSFRADRMSPAQRARRWLIYAVFHFFVIPALTVMWLHDMNHMSGDALTWAGLPAAWCVLVAGLSIRCYCAEK